MKKQQRIDMLIYYCKELSKLRDMSEDKTNALREMARLARDGKKDSEEFKKLEQKNPINQVIDYSGVVGNIVKIVKHL